MDGKVMDYKPTSKNIRKMCIWEILDVFEDFLEEHNVVIENPEKEESNDPAILYGTHYGELEDELDALLISWGFVDEKRHLEVVK